MSLLEEFYAKYGYAPKKNDGAIVDPGAKSVNSLISKAVRNIENDGKTDYTLNSVSDMARCTLVCDSYADAPKLITQLKQAFPDLTGYISRCANGYRGIHLYISVKGLKGEIQICTPKAYEYGQAAENIYAKWREFSPEQRENEILNRKQLLNNPDLTEQQRSDLETQIEQLQEQFKKDKRESAQEYGLTNKLFQELHSDSGFKENEQDVESLLLSYTLEKDNHSKTNHKTFRQFKVENGKLDKEDARTYIESIHSLAVESQTEMISKIHQFTQGKNATGQEPKQSVVDNIKFMIESFDNSKNNKINQSSAEEKEIINNHIRDYSIMKSRISVDFARYCIDKNLTEVNKSVVEEFFSSVQEQYKDAVLSLTDIKASAMDRLTPVVSKIPPSNINDERSKMDFEDYCKAHPAENVNFEEWKKQIAEQKPTINPSSSSHTAQQEIESAQIDLN